MARTLPQSRFVRRAVRKFLPGQDRGSALRAAEGLAARQIRAVFTLLGENVTNRAEVEDVVQEYLGLMEEIRSRHLDGEISVKLTQLGLDLDRAMAVDALRLLARNAGKAGSFVWVDMEGTPYLKATLDLFREVASGGEPVGICLQAYLRSSPEDLQMLLPLEPSVRIVKGAYAEPPSLAFPRRKEVDAAFFDLVTAAVHGGGRVAIATHDGALIERIHGWMRENGIEKDRYEYQMLFGIRPGGQGSLADRGEPVRVLISYGSSWFPWYMRRLAERPANLWFVLKSLLSR
ncbi:MAG: proline dehydrogenase family protein [Longimicrobiales bacterium]